MEISKDTNSNSAIMFSIIQKACDVVCTELTHATLSHVSKQAWYRDNMPLLNYWTMLYTDVENSIDKLDEFMEGYEAMPDLEVAYEHLCTYKSVILSIIALLECTDE